MSTQKVSLNSSVASGAISKIVSEQNNQAIKKADSVFAPNDKSVNKGIELISNTKKLSVKEVLDALNLTVDDISEIFDSIKKENPNLDIENLELEPNTIEQIMAEYKKQ